MGPSVLRNRDDGLDRHKIHFLYSVTVQAHQQAVYISIHMKIAIINVNIFSVVELTVI